MLEVKFLNLTLILISFITVFQLSSQENLEFTDINFIQYDGDSILKDSDYTILISNKSCRACTEYLTNLNFAESLVYIVEELSYVQMSILQSSSETNEIKIYFVEKDQIIEYIDYSYLSPSILSAEGNIIDYNKLKQISNNFSAKRVVFLKKL